MILTTFIPYPVPLIITLVPLQMFYFASGRELKGTISDKKKSSNFVRDEEKYLTVVHLHDFDRKQIFIKFYLGTEACISPWENFPKTTY